jgi:cytochrome c
MPARPDARSLRVLLLLACSLGAGCGEPAGAPHRVVGDVQRGLALVASYGCASCHTIPAVTQARGQLGPPLAGIARRAYLGGILPNTPENMLVWLRSPRDIDPRSAMPNLGMSESEARDMTAYLYTLK